MESDDGEYSDYAGDIDPESHEKLVENVLTIHKKVPVKKPLLSRYTPKQADIRVARSTTLEHQLLSVLDDDSPKGKKSKKTPTQSKKTPTNFASKTLAKPLEQPQAELIRRAVAYETTKLKLDRWEPIVTANRVSTNLTFPLDHNPKLEIKEAKEFTKTWRLKSKLQQELEKIDPPKVEVYEINTESEKRKVPQSIKEMVEHRNTMAKIRAIQSYKEAKARRQNKIKSKKFHRIQKKQKIKQQLKEFEELQKTNPEEAMKKLEEIDRIRAEERFSLRHRSTGKWAKNKQIRAKYDKESREMLAQQLTVGRELTQKLKHIDNDSDDDNGVVQDSTVQEEHVESSKGDSTNLWIGNIKPSQEVTDFVTSYKKFWTEKNNEISKEANKNDETVDEKSNIVDSDDDCNSMQGNDTIEADKISVNQENIIVPDKSHKKKVTNKEVAKTKVEKITPVIAKSNRAKTKKTPTNATDDWNVSSLDVEDIFQVLEDKLDKKMKKKAKLIKKDLKREQKVKSKKVTPEKSHYQCDLSLPRSIKKPILDEELNETAGSKTNENSSLDLPELENSALKKMLRDETSKTKDKLNQNGSSKGIDLQNIISTKTTELASAIPELLTRGEDSDDENNTQMEQLMDTFEDDGIMAEFTKEKKEEINKNRPQDIDLSLPGWGSWGGTGIKVSKRKRRRFIVKMPTKVPRRDDNKGLLIINEKAEDKIKDLKVSDVPFPFTSVKDYEASLRAPIGRTFVPEKAFRRHIKPAVQTKIGAIIEPMSKDVLLNK